MPSFFPGPLQAFVSKSNVTRKRRRLAMPISAVLGQVKCYFTCPVTRLPRHKTTIVALPVTYLTDRAEAQLPESIRMSSTKVLLETAISDFASPRVHSGSTAYSSSI